MFRLAWGWSFVPLLRSSPGFSQSWAAGKFLISNMPKTSPGSGDGCLVCADAIFDGVGQWISSTCLEVACYIFELARRVGDFLYCVLSLKFGNSSATLALNLDWSSSPALALNYGQAGNAADFGAPVAGCSPPLFEAFLVRCCS
ncbi:hypothetical protein Nepgr_006788 [Nepenthes gracilis]|uniref:Secreted protein n=1 Tax=Nepenthes gracilis TaxID=150966 RepID=A0AAD3XHP4_NEPGR|nr:hypothetical protein Nepgr_006788 [Nepenthes gracilis]